jgi:hypothetical protein
VRWRRIAAGRLPRTTKPEEVVAAIVVKGERCSLCDDVIKAGDCRYVIRTRTIAASPSQFALHFLCHAAWQLEAVEAERGAARDTKSPGQLTT